MSAQLADSGNSFHARLVLAAGVSVAINAPSMQSLSAVVAMLQPTEAANEGNVTPTPAAAATAPAGKPASTTAAPSASSAAASAGGDAGNASAPTGTPASAQPAASGSAAGDAGNASAAAQPAASSASTAAASTSAVSFEELKKAFLALSTKAGGRERCENVLKPFGLAKLSGAAPEQYAAVMAEILKASA